MSCARHKSHLSGNPGINFRIMCKSPGCARLSRWGLDGKQPTHCPDHGPLYDEFSALSEQLERRVVVPAHLILMFEANQFTLKLSVLFEGLACDFTRTCRLFRGVEFLLRIICTPYIYTVHF
ncbi:unnamed protein product [Laminaria digitata]